MKNILSLAWPAASLPEAVVYTVTFALLGMILAIVGYKLFDKFTPGNLHQEIVENKNVGAAIIGASVIIGTCIIVAAAMT
jgi:putative membrane protein